MNERRARSPRSKRGDAREIAALRSLAILKAIEMVLEGARTRRSWREFELVWFATRVEEARRTLANAPSQVRLAFVDDLRASYRATRTPSCAEPVATAAKLVHEELTRLFDELEGKSAAPALTIEAANAAANRIRKAGGFPFYNRQTRTIDRLPKAKAVGSSVWVVHQVPDERGYALSHGPSGTKLSVYSMPKARLEKVARRLAEELPDLARDAAIFAEVDGGPGGRRLAGGIPAELMRPLHAAIDRAMSRAGVSL
jgi:hypothetical protein